MNRIQYAILALLLGAFITQGFQCTSSEMTTARVAKKNKDFEKAITNYKKELSKNAGNIEAMYELAEIYSFQAMNERDPAKFEDYMNLIIKAKNAAESATLDKRTKARLENYRALEYNAWIATYNMGVQVLGQMSSGDLAKIEKEAMGQEALKHFNNAILLYPDNPDNYAMIGNVYAQMGNKAKAKENLNKYNTILADEINFFKSKGLTLGMTPKEFKSILGEPKQYSDYRQLLNPNIKTVQDTMAFYQYKVDGKTLHIFTKHNSKFGKTGIMGWRFTEDLQPYAFDITPTFELARIAFDEKDYETALKHIGEIQKLDPTNPYANRFMVQILDLQGKPEVAMQTMERLTREQPNNADYRAQYGDLLLRNKKFLEATAQYEAALKIRPNDVEITKVLGSAYKNYAVEVQKDEFQKNEKDANYNINEEAYTPYLAKSQAAFEAALATKEGADDYSVLLELADIYAATKEEIKFKRTIDKLIAMKDDVPMDNKEYYLGRMVFWLDRINDSKNLEVFTKELEEYK